MTATAAPTADYFEALPTERQIPMLRLREVLLAHLPAGFEEAMSYGIPAFVVPLSLYPAGYHCKKGEPLPFISLASQKGYIALHHMGLYSSEELLNWFKTEWAKSTTAKLDMGKGCIRFKKPDAIPYDVIGRLAEKLTPAQWIERYEATLKKQP